MIKPIIFVIVCLVILFSIQTTYAQEDSLPLPEGKNVKEWFSISAALVTENRFEEAIIYLDKVLEKEPDNLKALSNKAGLLIQVERFEDSLDLSNKVLEKEPDRVPTLINKAIALKMIKDYEKSYEVFTKILTLETDENIIETVKQARAALLSLTPTVSTNDSKFEVHVLVSIRDKDNNLIAVTESTNARFLESKFTEKWWRSLEKTEYLTIKDGIEKFQKTNEMVSYEDHIGMLTLERVMNDYTIVIFEAFIPMIQMEETDTAKVTWTILKK